MAVIGLNTNFKGYAPYTVPAAQVNGTARNFSPPDTSFWAERAEDITVTVKPQAATTATTYTLRAAGEAATATSYTVNLAAAFATPEVRFDTAPPANAEVIISLVNMPSEMREDIIGEAYSPARLTRLNLRAMLLTAVNAAHGGTSGGGGGGEVGNANPYAYFEQHKDIAINIPQGDSARIEETGDGYDIPFMAKSTHSQAVLADRNFVTDPEGFINLHFSGSGVVRADISFKTTHHFSDVDSSIPDLVTSSRTEQQEVVLGEANSVNLRAHGSNVVVTSASTGGALAGRSVPISIVINVKVFNNTGARVPGNVWGSGSKAGITFWQLADNRGAAGTAATITVGTVSTGAAGSNASVTNSGTASAAILNFVIPRGADGTGGGGGIPADNSIGVAKLNFAAGTDEAVGRAITIGAGGQFSTSSIAEAIPAARLLPTTGGAGGREIVDVFNNGAITPQWRDRIIHWNGAANTNLGFQRGDTVRYPDNGPNQNIYRVLSAVAPNTPFSSLAAGVFVRINNADLTGQIGVAQLNFASGTNENTGRFLTIGTNGELTTAIGGSGGGGGTVNTNNTLTGDGSSGQPLAVANPFTDDDESKLDGIAAGATVGATTAQALAIASNTQKRSYPTADETKLAGIEAGATVGATTAQANAIAANTQKRSYPAADEQKLAGIATGATVGATSAQAAAIAENTAKRTYPSADQTKLAGIEAGATADQTPAQIIAGIESQSGVNRLNYNSLKNLPTGLLTTVATNNTITGSGVAGSPLAVAIPATADDLVGTPTIQSGNLIFARRTGSSYSVPLPTGAAGNNIRTILFNTETNITTGNAGNTNEFNAGQNVTLVSGATFADYDLIEFVFGYTETRPTPDQDNDYVLVVSGATFRASTSAERVVISGTDTTTSGYVWGVYNNPAAGENANNSTRFNVALRKSNASGGGSGSNTYLKEVVGYQFRGQTGMQGAEGPAGTDGANATIAIGTVSTGNAGTNASVTNSGTASAATLDFVIPRGDTGPAGAAGTPGTDGSDGAAASITIANTITQSPGTDATVVNQGTANAASLVFGIPRGATGAQGATGATGQTGAKGDKGDRGDTGPAGADGTNGQGVPTGGTVGQYIRKTGSADFATEWADLTIPTPNTLLGKPLPALPTL